MHALVDALAKALVERNGVIVFEPAAAHIARKQTLRNDEIELVVLQLATLAHWLTTAKRAPAASAEVMKLAEMLALRVVGADVQGAPAPHVPEQTNPLAKPSGRGAGIVLNQRRRS